MAQKGSSRRPLGPKGLLAPGFLLTTCGLVGLSGVSSQTISGALFFLQRRLILLLCTPIFLEF